MTHKSQLVKRPTVTEDVTPFSAIFLIGFGDVCFCVTPSSSFFVWVSVSVSSLLSTDRESVVVVVVVVV